MTTINTTKNLNDMAQEVLLHGIEEIKDTIPVNQVSHPSRSVVLEILAKDVLVSNGDTNPSHEDVSVLANDIRVYFRDLASRLTNFHA